MSLANLWKFFHQGPAQNTAHKKAFCKGCVNYHLLQASLNAEISDKLDPAAILQAEQNSFDVGLSDFSANELF
jgi:hypothetical protein